MKKSLLLSTIVTLGLGLCSCHGTLVPSGGPIEEKPDYIFEVPQNFDTTREYNLTFWSKNDSNALQRQIYYDAIENFEKLYPNIHINMTSYTNYNDIYRDVLKNITTNTTPNICVAYPDHVATYKTGDNVIVDLDGLMNHELYGFGGSQLNYDAPTKEEVVTKYLDEGTLKNNQTESGYAYYTLPFMRSDEVLYVNKTYMLENNIAIPEVYTWDYIWEVCRYARNKYDSENSGKPDYKRDSFIPFIYKSVDNMFIQMCKQYGYDYTTEDGDILFDNPNTRAMIKELWNYTFKSEGLFDVFDRVSYPGNKYNRQECIFVVDSSAGATWIGSDAPLTEVQSIGQFETLVTNVPQDDENGIDVISQGPSICLFNKEDPQEVLASWIFSQYLLTNEPQIAYAQTEGYSPVTYKAINSKEFQDYLNNPSPLYKSEASDSQAYIDNYYVKVEATKNVIANIENSFVTPAFNGSSLVRSASGGMIFWIGGFKTMEDADLETVFARAKKNAGIS